MIAAARLAPLLARVAQEYAYARGRPFRGSPFASLIRRDLARAGREAVADWPERLIVRASPGRSDWAAVPWLAFLDPRETTSVRRGVYVAALINAQEETVILTLIHGTADLLRDLGQTRGEAELRRRAEAIRAALGPAPRDFSDAPAPLGSPAPLPRSYEASQILSRCYPAKDLTPDPLATDLATLLILYARVAGGWTG